MGCRYSHKIRAYGGGLMSDPVLVDVRLHFDGHHGDGLEFVEAETPDGESIDLGEWDIGAGGSTLKLKVPERCVQADSDWKGDGNENITNG